VLCFLNSKDIKVLISYIMIKDVDKYLTDK